MASDSRDIERMLEAVDPPRVVAGAHRDRLREELLERMHVTRTECEGVGWAWMMTGYRSNSLPTRLARACSAVVLMGAAAWGAGEAVHRVRRSFVIFAGPETPSIEVRKPDGSTRFVGGASATFAAPDDPNATEADEQSRHELIERAKATGTPTVVERQETDFGTVATYRATLDDGRIVTWAGGPEDLMTWERRTERLKHLTEALAAGRFEFVRRFATPDGVTMYSYRVRMPDGTSLRQASLMPEHDPERMRRHQKELDRAKAERKGTFVSEVEPLRASIPSEGGPQLQIPRMFLYRFRLSDGDVSMYSSPDPPTKASSQ